MRDPPTHHVRAPRRLSPGASLEEGSSKGCCGPRDMFSRESLHHADPVITTTHYSTCTYQGPALSQALCWGWACNGKPQNVFWGGPTYRCCHQGGSVPSPGVVRTKCDLSKPCPKNFFAFKILSGTANVVGPSMCFEGHV